MGAIGQTIEMVVTVKAYPSISTKHGPAKRETAFFVGNQFRNPDGFLVLGVFWPPRG